MYTLYINESSLCEVSIRQVVYPCCTIVVVVVVVLQFRLWEKSLSSILQRGLSCQALGLVCYDYLLS